MSYYQGDYYRGDPFLGGLIGVGAKILSRVAPRVSRAVSGIFRKKGVRTAAKVIGVGAGFELGARGAGKLLGPKGEEGLPRRRMNVANVKALRRSIRRAKGFAKLARRVMTWPIQRPPKGRGLFKKRGRR